MERKLNYFKTAAWVLLVLKIVGMGFSWWWVAIILGAWALHDGVMLLVITFGWHARVKAKVEAWAIKRLYRRVAKMAKQKV